MLKFAILAVSLLASTPALGQVTSAPLSAPQQTAAADKNENPLDKMVCRYEDTVGTRLGRHKVCATLREWKDQEDENRQAVDKIQQAQGTSPSG